MSACVCVIEGERENLKTISEGIQTASDTIYVCTTNRLPLQHEICISAESCHTSGNLRFKKAKCWFRG